MPEDRLCYDIENKIGRSPAKPDGQGGSPLPHGNEDRRHQAMARYLAGDRIEDICRELGCAKSWLYKWRARYQANDPAWARERARRPRSNPRQTPDRIEEAIVHLCQVWGPQGSGRTSAATIWQVLKEQAIDPLPSRRTISRILQRHTKEANRNTSLA